MEAQSEIRNERALMRIILLQEKTLLLLKMVIPYSFAGIQAISIKTQNRVIKGQIKSYHKNIFKKVKNKISFTAGIVPSRPIPFAM
jgi:hypothetical protein